MNKPINIVNPAPGVVADDNPEASLARKIETAEAQVTIIGQGYVGLPLATGFATAGFRVTGLDVDRERVKALNEGHSRTPDVSDETLQELRTAGTYRATHDFSVLATSDVIVICVPTPLRKSKDPDISYVLTTVEHIIKYLRPGQLVILESTTYPGTTEELLLPMFQSEGYTPGHDLFLAFSPERIDPGNRDFSVRQIPKITGGVTPACTRLAALFYGRIVDRVIEVSSPRVAELAKLYENVFRSVNIALANEFALMCRELGVHSREVIDAAASKPFGFMPFYPGPGIGGHCIPIDPAYLAWKMKFSNYQARFIPLAEEVNQSMPAHVIGLVSSALNERRRCLNGARILALGVAYKRGVGDTRESPALQIIKDLLAAGAEVSYADPHVPDLTLADQKMSSVRVDDDLLRSVDCVLILTDHKEFDYRRIVTVAPLIVDTRGATWGLPRGAGRVVSL